MDPFTHRIHNEETPRIRSKRMDAPVPRLHESHVPRPALPLLQQAKSVTEDTAYALDCSNRPSRAAAATELWTDIWRRIAAKQCDQPPAPVQNRRPDGSSVDNPVLRAKPDVHL